MRQEIGWMRGRKLQIYALWFWEHKTMHLPEGQTGPSMLRLPCSAITWAIPCRQDDLKPFLTWWSAMRWHGVCNEPEVILWGSTALWPPQSILKIAPFRYLIGVAPWSCCPREVILCRGGYCNRRDCARTVAQGLHQNCRTRWFGDLSRTGQGLAFGSDFLPAISTKMFYFCSVHP